MSVEIRVKDKEGKVTKVIELTEEEYNALRMALEDIDMYVDDEKIMDSIIKKLEVER
ncbi:MAG: hypothetical protein ACP6IS_08120 [Candidatus Asgardarchaeia archaeon]